MVKETVGRAIWTGSLNFGLVNIPVRLHSAVSSKTLDFDMLHKEDLSPIRYARICRADGHEIPFDQIVKGYEYQDGDYVVLTDDDFKKANVRATKTIDILDFANEEEVDSIYLEKPYYLEPDKGAEKPYILLRKALEKSKKVAIAKFVIRNRQHLGLLKPANGIIVLDQMRYFDEIRDASSLKIPDVKTDEKELEMALALIAQLTNSFDPKEYKDTYKEELERVIEEKSKGKTPKTKGEEPRPTDVKNLLETLKKSLEQQNKTQTIPA